MRQIEFPGASELEQDRKLARQVIGNADDFRFLIKQLAVGRDFKSFRGETNEDGATENRQRLHRLAHGDR